MVGWMAWLGMGGEDTKPSTDTAVSGDFGSDQLRTNPVIDAATCPPDHERLQQQPHPESTAVVRADPATPAQTAVHPRNYDLHARPSDCQEWYHPLRNHWPIWLATGANCLVGSAVCTRLFKSRIAPYKGRVAIAVGMSVTAAVIQTGMTRRFWRDNIASIRALKIQNLLYTTLVVGPLAGFLGGAAVSQPTDTIRYKGNPAYFVMPAVRQYAMRPSCWAVGLTVGVFHWYTSKRMMEEDLAWQEQVVQYHRARAIASGVLKVASDDDPKVYRPR